MPFRHFQTVWNTELVYSSLGMKNEKMIKIIFYRNEIPKYIFYDKGDKGTKAVMPEYLFDNGKMVYIWCGKARCKKEKRMGILFAKKYKELTSEKLSCSIVLVNVGSKKFSIDKVFDWIIC